MNARLSHMFASVGSDVTVLRGCVPDFDRVCSAVCER